MKRTVITLLTIFTLIITGCGKQKCTEDVAYGLSLANAPSTHDFMPLYEQIPPGSGNLHLRTNVVVVFSYNWGVVLNIPDQNKFYVQHDHPGSSDTTFYGPFDGDPREMMDIPKSKYYENGKPRKE